MSEPKVAQFVCEHSYGSCILGGHPVAVRICALCHRPDWDDLYWEAEALFRWGWQEGAAGKPLRGRLKSYDRPQEGDLQLLLCSLAHCRQAHPPHSWEPQPGVSPVRCEGYGSGDTGAT